MSPGLHVVVIRTADLARAREALRCAVGLTLRGGRVRVLFLKEAGTCLSQENLAQKELQKPIEWLARLGHELYAELESSPHEEIEPISSAEVLEKIAEGETSAAW